MPVRVFIGSSSESKDVAHALQSRLESMVPDCEVTVWDQGVFELSGYAIPSLEAKLRDSDFAILVLAPDDEVSSRGQVDVTPRDNVVLELGMAIGVLGLQRVILLRPLGPIRLPTDLLGITTAQYKGNRSDNNLAAALTAPAQQIAQHIASVGARPATPAEAETHRGLPTGRTAVLEWELALLIKNAEAQGWAVKRSETALRLTSPRQPRKHVLPVRDEKGTREALRPFVAVLRAHGLRVNSALREAP